MTAVIDKGENVETISGIEAYDIHTRRGVVDLYTSPENKTTVDTFKHKLTFKDGPLIVAVMKDGELSYA